MQSRKTRVEMGCYNESLSYDENEYHSATNSLIETK